MRALGGYAAHYHVVADEDTVVSRRFFGFASPPEHYEIIVIPPDPSSSISTFPDHALPSAQRHGAVTLTLHRPRVFMVAVK